MGIKLIANTAIEDAVQVTVSDVSTTEYDVTDAMNVTGGPRHAKAATDVAERAIIYRNNDKRLKADCCVLSGASRSFGHALSIKHFGDCTGTWAGGTGSTLQFWDANDFGRAYARDFDGINQHASISDANQVGLGFTEDFWFAGWIKADVAANGFLAKNGGGSDNGYFAEINTAGSPHLRFGVSSDGTAQTIMVHPDTLSTGTYYFLFLYHDDGVGIGGSINGAAFTTAVHTGGVYNSSQGFYLARHPAAGQYFNGSMCLWCCGTNIDAGPLAMAGWLYNGGAGRNWHEWSAAKKTAFGLVSHWSCDENSGDIVDDYGPNTLTDNNSVGVAAGATTNYQAIADRFSDTTNSNEADAAQFNTTEIVGPVSPPKIKPGGMANFIDSSQQFLSRANADITGLNGGDADFSIGMWYRQDSATSVGGLASMAGSTTTDKRYGLYNQSGTLYFEMFDNTGASVYPGSGITNGTWYFVVCTYDQSTRAVSLYLNNSLAASATLGAGTNVSTADFRLGSYITGNYGYCSLKNAFAMDSVISTTDMTYLYNGGAGRKWELLPSSVSANIGSWWPLNESSGERKDFASWGNHLTSNNDVGFTSEPGWERESAPQDLIQFFPSRSASFVAANGEYLNRANADITGLNAGDEDFTWGGWVNQTNYSGGTIYGYVSMGNGGTTDRRFLVMFQAGIIYFQIYNTSGSSKYINTSAVLTDTWYHVCATYNATTKGMALYLDGVLVDSDTHTGTLNTCATGYRLGYYPGSKYGWCKMRNCFQLEKVIESEELAFIYNGGVGRDWDELIEYNGLQDTIGSWWPLNESSGVRGDRGRWDNTLSDNNTVGYDDSPLVRDGGGLICGQEGFGVFLGAGSGSAYAEELTKAYFGESLDLGTATFPVVERPAYGRYPVGSTRYATEKAVSLVFENLNRDQIRAFEKIDFSHPVYLYDSTARFLRDKLWHCIITDYQITPEFDDLNTLQIEARRLKHYEVKE